MRRRLRGLGILILIAGVSAAVVIVHTDALAKKKPKMKQDAAPEEIELQELLAPSLQDEMHLIIEHYLQAAVNYSYGKYEESILHLKVMEYYIDFLPGLMPKTNLDGTPINEEQFKAHVKKLRDVTVELRTLIEKKKYKKVEQVGMDNVIDICLSCHTTVKVPNAWEAGKEYSPE